MKYLSILILILCIHTASAQKAFYVKQKPQGKVVVVKPNAPSAKHVWCAGDWVWNPKQKRYVWVDGYWAIPSNNHTVWVNGHWKSTNKGWIWIPGHWK